MTDIRYWRLKLDGTVVAESGPPALDPMASDILLAINGLHEVPSRAIVPERLHREFHAQPFRDLAEAEREARRRARLLLRGRERGFDRPNKPSLPPPDGGEEFELFRTLQDGR
jgi:hypothetical protein